MMKNQNMHILLSSLLIAATGFSIPVHAALTDIANAPLVSSTNTVKPNILFLLDDSGSMGWDRMSPDTLQNTNDDTNYCYENAAYNGVYYDPAITYTLPVDSTRASYPNANFAAAKNDGFCTGSCSTSDLRNNFRYGGSNSNSLGPTQAFYYRYNGASAPAKGVCYPNTSYTKVLISAGTSEAQNFANWYSYYRTRILSMKSAVGLAFKDIDDGYRVGFDVISNWNNASLKQHIADFDDSTKNRWYTSVYGVDPSGTTPLRMALAKAGRIFAGKSGADPMQYSCQQNFTILTTDGLWNESDTPKQIDGTTDIGNQDGTADRPMFDGATVSSASPPSNAISAYMSDNGHKMALGLSRSNPDSRRCYHLGANAYFCRGSGSDNPVVNQSSVTDASGATWYLVSSVSGGANCITNRTAFGRGYSTSYGACPSTTGATGGSSNSLADVAMYYYQTDLRTPALNNCAGTPVPPANKKHTLCTSDEPDPSNNVPRDATNIYLNSFQHMVTFTLGLGVNGTLQYSNDYLGGGSADYNAIKAGTKDWPAPVRNEATTVDDLWHAAVNGRGQYFSAQDSASLVSALGAAIRGINDLTGAASAASVSSLKPTSGDNYVYAAVYNSGDWSGDMLQYTIDPDTAAVSADASWAAQALLDTKVAASSDTRTIYTYDSGGTNNLKPFLYANLTATEKAYFDNKASAFTQYSGLSAANKDDANSGDNLVNYLRGQTNNEDNKLLYRDRSHVLGDMVNAQPTYVHHPQFSYVDANYAAFKATPRNAMVYVGGNDGMLHAFDATAGDEEWAYVPPMVMSNLYKLANNAYPSNHQYFVDGSPAVGDICPNAPTSICTAAQWKTILVAGLNAGGRGYYALDITDPANPKALWNFTSTDDPDLGYTFGNPIITKRKNGTWIVAFASGYNNVSPGTGGGFLFVLNADTGEVLEKIPTYTSGTKNAGNTTTPSGLAKINAWVNSETDNTAERFYGGDLLGNVWRFDIDNVVPPAGKEAVLLAELGGPQGAATQPITTRPELASITKSGTSYNVVFVGTGRYLGNNNGASPYGDVGNTDQQSVYAFKDNLADAGLGALRKSRSMVQQTLSNIAVTEGQQPLRKVSNEPVDWAINSGWYVDFNPDNTSPGERVDVNMQQHQGTLTVATNVPDPSPCSSGGSSFLYYFDFASGSYLLTASMYGDTPIVGVKVSSDALTAGIGTVMLSTGNTATIITDSKGRITTSDDPGSAPTSGSARRVFWRELTN